MLLLYEHPLSSYVQKVKIALREKGVAFKAELPADFGTGRTEGPCAAINPRVEVPVLTDGPTQIFDSTVIMEYIEERWPEPPLLPREPAAWNHALHLASSIMDGTVKIGNTSARNEKPCVMTDLAGTHPRPSASTTVRITAVAI